MFVCVHHDLHIRLCLSYISVVKQTFSPAAAEGNCKGLEGSPSSPGYVRLLLQVMLPEEAVPAVATSAQPSPSSAAHQSSSTK